MKQTAVYCRVSTVGQDHASQVPDLQAWVDAHDGPVVWYRDKFTGRSMERPAMGRLMQAMLAGKVARVVVWRLDRLGRTAKGLCSLFDELRIHKVDLLSLREGFSLHTPAGRLQAQILASVAEYESEVRAERVKAGQLVARAKGKRWGGSKPGRYLKVKPEQVKAIQRGVAKGEPISSLARITGLSRPTIYRVLRNVGQR